VRVGRFDEVSGDAHHALVRGVRARAEELADFGVSRDDVEHQHGDLPSSRSSSFGHSRGAAERVALLGVLTTEVPWFRVNEFASIKLCFENRR
jgi:hypothetical protein